MKKDRALTKQKLIDAAGNIILSRGFTEIGINIIAKEAGVDKVLIYRYFGGLDGLLQEFVKQKDYFINMNIADFKNIKESDVIEMLNLGKQVFIGQLRDLLKNKEYQEILKWELNEKNEVTLAIAKARENQGIRMINEIQKHFEFKDLNLAAVLSILIGGINFLVLRSNTVNIFNGIKFNSKGWKKIEEAISTIFDALANRIKKK